MRRQPPAAPPRVARLRYWSGNSLHVLDVPDAQVEKADGTPWSALLRFRYDRPTFTAMTRACLGPLRENLCTLQAPGSRRLMVARMVSQLHLDPASEIPGPPQPARPSARQRPAGPRPMLAHLGPVGELSFVTDELHVIDVLSADIDHGQRIDVTTFSDTAQKFYQARHRTARLTVDAEPDQLSHLRRCADDFNGRCRLVCGAVSAEARVTRMSLNVGVGERVTADVDLVLL